MKFYVHAALTSFALIASKASAADDITQRKLTVTEQDQLAVCYPDQQWVDYDGTSYIFNRQRYHTQCVDMQQQPFEYGALSGYYTTGEPCASACVQGDNRSQLKGCYPEDRPPLEELVGYEYDCDMGTCYCLYNEGTLSSQYSNCFDSMNRSGQGYLTSGESVSTITNTDRTCYSLHTQSETMPGSSICTRSLDFDCYKTGRPACCNSASLAELPSTVLLRVMWTSISRVKLNQGRTLQLVK
eukprot:scaffold4691_cov132-Skeletonema_menzelii.AAC.7